MSKAQTTAVAIRQDFPSPSQSMGLQVQDFDDLERFAQVAHASGMFKDLKGTAEACIKILRGKELGLAPMESLSAFHIVEGRPTLAAQTMAALVLRAGFSYDVLESSHEACALKWFNPQGRELGVVAYTMDDARQARLADRNVWKSHPKAMLRARAQSAGCRLFAPHVLLGIYTPDEVEDMRPIQPAPPQPPPMPMPRGPMQALEAPAPDVDCAECGGVGGCSCKCSDCNQVQCACQKCPACGWRHCRCEGKDDGAHPGEEWKLGNRALRGQMSMRKVSDAEIHAVVQRFDGVDSLTKLPSGQLFELADCIGDRKSDADKRAAEAAAEMLAELPGEPELGDLALIRQAPQSPWAVILVERVIAEALARQALAEARG